MRLRLGGIAALSTVVGLLMTAPAASAANISYVALGDSYSSASGVPNSIGSPECTRSSQNYAHLVAVAIGANLTDVTCGGATTADMTQPQFGFVPPQFNALTADTQLVTVGIGGNDVPFAAVAATCVGFGFSNPWGSPCKGFYNASGTDQGVAMAAAVGPKVAAVVQGIHSRAPNAKIVVVGYPIVVPTSGGTVCFSYGVPIAAGDLPYVNQIEQTLNAVIKAAAEANGAVFADPYPSSIGHDACRPANEQWMIGLIPMGNGYVPAHPNALGEQNMANQVLSKLQ